MTSYAAIRQDVRTGDVALWRNGGFIGRLDNWTHASRFFWFGKTLLLVEFREWRGAQVVTAREQIKKYPGSLCVFRPRGTTAQAYFATELMLRQVGKRYGWWIIGRQIWQRANLLRLITGASFDEGDTTPMAWTTPKDCSAAVVWSDRMALGPGHQDKWPCQDLADWACAPKHLANDVYYELKHRDVVLEEVK